MMLCRDLLARMKQLVAWDQKPATVTTITSRENPLSMVWRVGDDRRAPMKISALLAAIVLIVFAAKAAEQSELPPLPLAERPRHEGVRELGSILTATFSCFIATSARGARLFPMGRSLGRRSP
jgi:hypothetical protein